MRTEPPVSVPIPTTAPPSLTDTAAPEDDPPGITGRVGDGAAGEEAGEPFRSGALDVEAGLRSPF
jgi:hypothetical protein